MTKKDTAAPEPEEIEPTYLAFTWSVSRGRETYGYNIMTVTDQSTGKLFRCSGGGYDMTGTSFGDWMEQTYQGRLQTIAGRAAHYGEERTPDTLYGMFINTTKGEIMLDGGCGFSSMERIAEAIGLKLERTYKTTGRNRGETTGYIVSAA